MRLGFLLIACGAFAPAQQFSTTALVKQIEQKARDARQYEFEADLLLGGQRGDAPGKVLDAGKVHLAVGLDGKSLLRVETPNRGEYLLISDGQKSWGYVPKLKQYTEEESSARAENKDEDGDAGSDSDEDAVPADTPAQSAMDPLERYAREVMPILSRLYSTAASAARGADAQVKFENKKQKWPMIQVITKKSKDGGSSMTELTLDPATLEIGRMVWANLSYVHGEKVVLRLTMDFRSFRMGESLPDSTFRFDPPKNARLVEVLPIPGQAGSALLNHTAPDFELKTLTGDRIRLQDLRGKPVLLSFFASWCGPCRRELPDVVKLYDEFKGSGLQVYGINDEGKSTAHHFAEKSGLTFPILDDSGEKAARLYRIRSIPTTFLIDKDGKVVRYLNGGRDYDTLRSALKSVGL